MRSVYELRRMTAAIVLITLLLFVPSAASAAGFIYGKVFEADGTTPLANIFVNLFSDP